MRIPSPLEFSKSQNNNYCTQSRYRHQALGMFPFHSHCLYNRALEFYGAMNLVKFDSGNGLSPQHPTTSNCNNSKKPLPAIPMVPICLSWRSGLYQSIQTGHSHSAAHLLQGLLSTKPQDGGRRRAEGGLPQAAMAVHSPCHVAPVSA